MNKINYHLTFWIGAAMVVIGWWLNRYTQLPEFISWILAVVGLIMTIISSIMSNRKVNNYE